MQKNNLVRGFHSSIEFNNKICEGCAIRKKQRSSFPHYQFRSYEPLALVHSDICGPMQILSLGNNKYFLLFVDDYSRVSRVYFRIQNSQAFNCFQKFKVRAEKES